MSLQDTFPIPAVPINGYVWDKLKQLDGPGGDLSKYTVRPFFPISDAKSGDAFWQSNTYVIYDQLMKFRETPFYPVHKEQVLYFVRGTATNNLVWTNAIAHILDRGDQAGKDVNAWMRINQPDCGIYFHSFKVFQVDHAAEQRTDQALNQRYVSTMVIEYTYHLTKTMGFD